MATMPLAWNAACCICLPPVWASGRSLDFLLQELFREFNTMGSKANHAPLAQIVVRGKTEIEKIREQVQNIE